MRYAWVLRMSGILLCCATAIWSEEALTVVPGRVPYLGETVGHVVVTTAPDRPGEALTLQVATVSGTVLRAGRVVPGSRSAVEVPLVGLAEGTTVLHCRLLAAGKEVVAADTRLTRLPPKPQAVQIDNRRRGLIVDGLPFFPILCG